MECYPGIKFLTCYFVLIKTHKTNWLISRYSFNICLKSSAQVLKESSLTTSSCRKSFSEHRPYGLTFFPIKSSNILTQIFYDVKFVQINITKTCATLCCSLDEPRVEIPEIINAKQHCFRTSIFFSADSENMKKHRR